MLFHQGLLKTISECLENMSLNWGAKQSSLKLKIHSVIWTTKGQSNIKQLWLLSHSQFYTVFLLVVIFCCWCCCHNNNPMIISLLQRTFFTPWLLILFIGWLFTHVEGRFEKFMFSFPRSMVSVCMCTLINSTAALASSLFITTSAQCGAPALMQALTLRLPTFTWKISPFVLGFDE